MELEAERGLRREGRTVLFVRLSYTALVVSFALGCSSPEVLDQRDSPEQMTASLTIVVVSQHLQRNVPAVGRVTALGDGRSQPVDTSGSPESGVTLTGLQPGRYSVKVEHRSLTSGKQQSVDGEEIVYLEPGADRSVTVIVTDSKDGEVGYYLPQHPPTQSSSPHLPLELTPG